MSPVERRTTFVVELNYFQRQTLLEQEFKMNIRPSSVLLLRPILRLKNCRRLLRKSYSLITISKNGTALKIRLPGTDEVVFHYVFSFIAYVGAYFDGA